MNAKLKKAINTAYTLYGKNRVGLLHEAREFEANGSPHGFLRLRITKPDYRGERIFRIFYGKKTELYFAHNEQDALLMWRRLCKLELHIVKTIGGELLNQW